MKIQKPVINSIILILFLTGGCTESEYASWRFITIPDYHNAEGFVQVWGEAPEGYTSQREKRIADQTEQFRQMKERFGGELIILPGDCNGGHWYREKYLQQFKSYPDYVNYDTKQVILESSRLCYQGLWDIVHNGGYENFLMAVGDHELGDNPWGKGREVARHINTFREGFATTFTLDENGKSRFTRKIGNAMPRPLGTRYEHTSNALQFKNVLFVTLDIFRFDGEDKVLGEEGVVKGDIEGKHLEWFESVLREAQEIPSVKHIVVQSHLPIIYPVKKYASSGMMVDQNDSEKILNLLRKYNVDLYLAGEVHMNTVTKDPGSNMVQLVARGNDLSNMTMVDVENDKLILSCYHQNGDKLGSLSINKSSPETTIEGSGVLKPINPKGLQIHWSFNKQLDKSKYKNSIEGAFPKQVKHNPLLSSIERPIVYLNDGGFGYDYSLIGDHAEQAEGVLGEAVNISDSTDLFVLQMGPMEKGFERTVACWVKTRATGRRLILNSGSYWSKTGQFFNLGLNKGNLELALRPEIYTATNSLTINDGKWHHIAVVLPYKDANIKELKLFVDGRLIVDKQTERPGTKIKTAQANWISIASQVETYKTKLASTMDLQAYTGSLDDFALWTRALTYSEIELLYSEGLKGKDALEVEAMLENINAR